MDTYSFGYNSSTYVDMPISHKVFLAQFDAIKNIANEGACVIVGRCADYALADYKNCIHLFIRSDIDNRIALVSERFNLSPEKAKEMIIKKDKQRSSYYNYYSSKKWDSVDSYDMIIDSSILGIDGTVALLIQLVKDFEKKNNQ